MSELFFGSELERVLASAYQGMDHFQKNEPLNGNGDKQHLHHLLVTVDAARRTLTTITDRQVIPKPEMTQSLLIALQTILQSRLLHEQVGNVNSVTVQTVLRDFQLALKRKQLLPKGHAEEEHDDTVEHVSYDKL
jgi:hypothetical protein